MAALAAGRPELAVLATPFALLVAVALAGAPLALDGELRLERDRALEGESLRAMLAVTNLGAPARVDVHLPVAACLGTDVTPIGFWLARGERRELEFVVTARRWACTTSVQAIARARDRLGRPPSTARWAKRPNCASMAEPSDCAGSWRRCGPGPSSAARSRASEVRASSSPTSARSRRATASAASTGARPPAAAPRTSTSSTRSTAPTSSCSSTTSRTPRGPSTRRCAPPRRSPPPTSRGAIGWRS